MAKHGPNGWDPQNFTPAGGVPLMDLRSGRLGWNFMAFPGPLGEPLAVAAKHVVLKVRNVICIQQLTRPSHDLSQVKKT